MWLVLCGRCASHQPLAASKLLSRTITFDRINASKSGIGVSGYFLALFPVAAFGLGTWQVQRRQWKLDLIKELQGKTSLPPVPLPTQLEDIQELQYRPVQVRGHFDHSREMYILPRSLVTGKKDLSTGSLISTAQSGSWVVTPFVLADRDMTILVNRGWVPKERKLPRHRTETFDQEDKDLVGIVRVTEQRVPLAFQHLTSDMVNWGRRDVEKMASAAGCAPVFIDAVVGSSVPGGPVGGQTRVALRNEHFSYILTWYSLSGVTAYLWYTRCFKKALFR